MNLKVQLRRWSGKRPGDLEWDSETGVLAGSLADEVAEAVEESKAAGYAGWGPQCCLEYPIVDPLRRPPEMAVVLDSMGFVLPAELAAVYPEPPAERLEDPELSPEERSRVVF